MKACSTDLIPTVLLEVNCLWSPERCDDALCALPERLQKRASRYLVEAPKRTLVASHTILHQALRALHECPEKITVADNGRPYIEKSNIEFNLSHSQDWAVIAITRGRDVKNSLGVDIEGIHRNIEHSALAERFFTPKEQEFIDNDLARFFYVWTRKEALLKSNGTGLRVELDSFDVLAPVVPAAITGVKTSLGSCLRRGEVQVSWALPDARTEYPLIFLDTADQAWQQDLVVALGLSSDQAQN